MRENYGLILTCNYPNTNAELNGCYNDGLKYKKFLEEKYNVKNIIEMNDTDYNIDNILYPKRENIINELIKLSKLEANNLFIYFSGHGSYLNDWNLDEMNVNDIHNIQNSISLNKDSILVTNEGNKIGYLLDDKINELLQLFDSETTIFGVFDCCHSGTICDLKYVFAPIKELLGYKIYPLNYNIPEMKAKVFKIAGSKDNNVAYEAFINGKMQGVLTHFLLINLENSLNQKLSFNDLLLNLTNQITTRLNSNIQIPILSCSRNLNLKESFFYQNNSKNLNSKNSNEYFILNYNQPIKNNSIFSGCSKI